MCHADRQNPDTYPTSKICLFELKMKWVGALFFCGYFSSKLAHHNMMDTIVNGLKSIVPYPTLKNGGFELQNGQILKWVGAVSKWGQTDDIFVNVMTYTLAQIQCCKAEQKSLQNFVLNSHVSSEDTRRVLPTFSNQGKKSGVSLLVPNPGLLYFYIFYF